MSAATKQKLVFLESEKLVLPGDNQSIVRIIAPRGNNLHDVETPNGEKFIVTMPVKYRKSIWMKRGKLLF
jgi:probable RNA-binding protein EIF1AD